MDLRDGENVPHVPEMVAVLAAAGWKTDLVLKEFGGESLKLAEQAAQQGYDVVIAYGGDGTLNQVVNGIMNVQGKSMVAVLPGGTANEWATEIEEPLDPVHAALALVNSEAHKVDLGYVGVNGLVFPHAAHSPGQHPLADQKAGQKARKNQAKKALGTQHRFLLMAGLGLDSSLIAHVSKSLKYRIGRLAYGVSAVKDLPEQRPFPLELRAIADDGSETLLWQGEAWQVIFGNTRLYAGFAEVTPQAYVDDGNLDVAVIPAGDVFQTVEEVVSLLVKHRAATEYFHGAHFSVRVPASIGLHLDGCVVELDDYLSTSMAIPRTYHGALFEHWTAQAHPPSGVQQQNEPVAQAQPAPPERVQTLLQQGTKVTVTGVGPQADKPNTFIIAGTRHHPTTEDTSPIAVRVTDKSMVLQRTGQHVPPPAVQHLPEGVEIVVEGKKGKSGSLRATQVVMERIESLS
ncbi:MAG: hypothetical protein E6J22_20570 [Chloroflexi bacterium]|nr:MAG: hypothetical protein E6J22_20570 [Chloroflexota bacterium]